MRFWDSSALLSLVLPEPASFRVAIVISSDSRIALWWATPIECFGEGFRVLPYSEEVNEARVAYAAF